jgi:hypothetical protein
MIEDELVKIWQSSPNQERVKFEKSRLIMEVQSTVDDVHKKIKNRDLAELLAGVLIIPVFAFYAYSIPFVLTKIASVLIICWGIFVIIRLRNAKKHKPGAFTESYLDYLYKTREYLKIQMNLIDSVLNWYILPASILVLLFNMGPGIAGRLLIIVKWGAFLVVFGAIIYYLNKRTVKKQFIPRLEKIDKLIDMMEKS